MKTISGCRQPVQAVPHLHPQGLQDLPRKEEERGAEKNKSPLFPTCNDQLLGASSLVGYCRGRLPQHVAEQEGQRHVDHWRVWCRQDREHQEGDHLLGLGGRWC